MDDFTSGAPLDDEFPRTTVFGLQAGTSNGSFSHLIEIKSDHPLEEHVLREFITCHFLISASPAEVIPELLEAIVDVLSFHLSRNKAISSPIPFHPGIKARVESAIKRPDFFIVEEQE